MTNEGALGKKVSGVVNYFTTCCVAEVVAMTARWTRVKYHFSMFSCYQSKSDDVTNGYDSTFFPLRGICGVYTNKVIGELGNRLKHNKQELAPN